MKKNTILLLLSLIFLSNNSAYSNDILRDGMLIGAGSYTVGKLVNWPLALVAKVAAIGLTKPESMKLAAYKALVSGVIWAIAYNLIPKQAEHDAHSCNGSCCHH